MDRWYLPDAFIIPTDYRIPEGEALLTDTHHPETNSQSYNYKVSQYIRPADYPPFYSSITQNEEGLFILAANNFNTCVFDGIIGATHDFNNFITSNLGASEFKIYLKENAFNLQFLEDSMFVATTTNNTIDLYNTKEPLTEGNVMRHVARDFSDGGVTCLSQLNDGHRFVVGTKKGSIEGFDYSTTEIQPLFSFMNAHETKVRGICSHPTLQCQWISCSSYACMFWDKRQVYPARALLSKKNIVTSLNNVHWYADNYVIVTDSSGEYMVFDCRNSNDVIFQMTINDDIEKLILNENKLGIISKSLNKTKLYEINQNQEPILLHEHISPGPVYSMCWDKTGQKPYTCYIVGGEKYAKEVNAKGN